MSLQRLRGLGAACGNAAHDVVRVRHDGVAGRSRGLGEANGDGVAMASNGFKDLCAACANAADDVLALGAKGPDSASEASAS